MSYKAHPQKKPKPPLNAGRLQDLALFYAGRFATTRAKLTAYLTRKLRERGWDGDDAPDPEAISERMAELGYVDDAGYAAMKAGALTRAGYGARRVGQALGAAGIGQADGAAALESAASDAWLSAERFARKKRIGPFAAEAADRPQREKQIAAYLRAGHRFDVARKWVDAPPGDVPEEE
jgi:regulatory protein